MFVRFLTVAALIMVTLFAAANPALAQSGGGYVIKKSTIDSGGATVTGGGYKLSGTVGQHDAGPLSGGDYWLTGGFWSPAAVGGAPPLSPEPEVPDPNDPIPNASGTKERYISFSLNMADAAKDTGLRVKLTSLHHPAAPVPPGTPSFTTFQGQYRYVNLLGTGTCSDSAVRVTSVMCGVLSCTPEYRDWATLLSGKSLHVTGAEIVPDATYDVSHLANSCAGTEAACAGASAELAVKTARWGNVDGSGTNAAADVNVTDITTVVNKVKDLAGGTVIKPRGQVQPQIPVTTSNVNVLDIANTVDAVKFKAYPFAMSNCP